MKLVALLLVCVTIPLVLAQAPPEQVAAGPYQLTLSTIPEQLEPGQSTLILQVKDSAGLPVSNKDVGVRLWSGKKTYFASTLRTDEAGITSLTYLFNGPGNYQLSVNVDGDTVALPVDVHGQYMLLFGFLAAVFIVFALLLDRL